jgi:hypothetical protein
MTSISRFGVACGLICAAGVLGFAQTTTALPGGVISSYGLGPAAFGPVQYTVTISLSYGAILPGNQYVSQSQLITDFKGFVAAYPNPNDPVEAIVSSVANSFALKYPQVSSIGLVAASASPYAQISTGVTTVALPSGPVGMLANRSSGAAK